MRARLGARVRERADVVLARNARLIDKALRDPERFLADARSPQLRRLGAIAKRAGLLPAAPEDGRSLPGPRSIHPASRERALELAVPLASGRLSLVEGNRLVGDVSSGSAAPVALVVRVDGGEVARFVAEGTFDVCVDLGREASGPAVLEVVCSRTGRPLDGTPRTIVHPQYEGALTGIEHGRVRGHVRDVATGAPVHIELLVDGRVACTLRVGAKTRRPLPFLGRITHAFSATYAPRRTDSVVALRVRGSDRTILGTPRPIGRPSSSLAVARRRHVASTSPDLVHVLIPVYGGMDETLRCIDAASTAKNRTPSHLTVIWDAGPDARLLDAIRERAKRGAFTLIENDENLGFVRTCNRGMRLRPDEDVVLLNADTEVAEGWLDRLSRAARSSPDIGTATPFSNAATICTYPTICEEHTFPEDETVASLDARFARVNEGAIVDLPTGHGFCLFIRRAMLDTVGLFDEEAFGRGYGEENDLCLRGRAAGYRSVLAGDVFVKHVGSVSFGAERSERVRTALETIGSRYPSYTSEVDAFIRLDPAARLRARVVVESLRELGLASRIGTVLMVTHHLGGGVEVNVRALEKHLVREGARVIVLSSEADGTLRLRDAAANLEATYFDTRDLAGILAEDLGRIAPRLVHVHQVLTFPAIIQDVIASLGVPFDVTLHDFFYVCPRVNLVRASGTFCGQPSNEVCDVCVAIDGPHEITRVLERTLLDGIEGFRAGNLAWLSRARRVIAPSHDTARRVERAFPSLAITVLPHPDDFTPAPWRSVAADDHCVHVAVLGAIGVHKGYRCLLDVARHATAENLPLRFVVFGTTLDSGALRALANVEVTGRYVQGDLPRLIETSRCTVAAFFSLWPETYSYTLSEALSLGLYPICLDIGAPAERLRALGSGTLLPTNATPAEVCAAFLRARHGVTPLDVSPSGGADLDIARSYYALAPTHASH